MKKPPSLILSFFSPLLILLGGIIWGGIYAYKEIPPLLEETARGLVPDGFVTSLESPGKYTIWLQVRGQIGETFHRGEETLPPGGKIYVFDESTGREIQMTNWVSATKSVGHEKAISLGTILCQRAGQEILIKGSGFQKPVLVSISPANTGAVMRVVLSLLGIVAVTLTAAILLFMALLHRRQKALEEEGKL